MSTVIEDVEYAGDTWPISELEWELEVNGIAHSGPGLAAVINLNPLDPEGDKAYFEVLTYFSQRGCPWIAKNHFSYYNPTEWNGMNDSLVRGAEARQKRPENYDQLLLGVSLV